MENNLPTENGPQLNKFIEAHRPGDVAVDLYAPVFGVLFQSILDWRVVDSIKWITWISRNYPGQLIEDVFHYVAAWIELRRGGAKMYFVYDDVVDEARGVVIFTPKYLYYSCDFFIQMRGNDPKTEKFYQMAFDIVKPSTVEVALPQLKSWEGDIGDYFGGPYMARTLEIA